MGIKRLRARRLIWQFPNKNLKRRGIEDLLRKLRETGSLDRRKGSGRPHTSRSCDSISAVEEPSSLIFTYVI